MKRLVALVLLAAILFGGYWVWSRAEACREAGRDFDFVSHTCA